MPNTDPLFFNNLTIAFNRRPNFGGGRLIADTLVDKRRLAEAAMTEVA
jgi:hypothetical protein